MRYALHRFAGLTNAEVQALEAIGISDSDHLLEQWGAFSWSGEEERLAGIPIDRINELLIQADLVRVKGIGPVTARVLVNAGVRGVSDLAISRPEDLRAAIAPGRRPSRRRLGQLIEDAAELRVRLQATPVLAREFVAHVRQRWDLEETARRPMYRAMILMTLLALLAAFPLAAGWDYLQDGIFGAGAKPEDAALIIESIRGLFRRFSLVLMVCVLVALGGTAIACVVAFDALGKQLFLRLLPRFLRRDSERACYLEFSRAMTVGETKRWSWRALALVGLLVVVLVGLGSREGPSYDVLRSFVTACIVGAPLVVGIALRPFVLRMKALKETKRYTWISVWRVAQWHLLYIFVTLVFLLATIRVMIPASISTANWVSSTWLLPNFRTEVDSRLSMLQEYHPDVVDDSVVARLLAGAAAGYEHDLQEMSKVELTVSSPDGPINMLDAVTPIAVSWIGFAAVFGFALPLMLHDSRRSFIYLGLIAMAVLLELLIGSGIQSWAGVSTSALVRYTILALVILATEFAVEWIEYNSIADRGPHAQADVSGLRS